MPLRVRTSRANKPELLVMMEMASVAHGTETALPLFSVRGRRIRRVKRRDISSGVWPERHRPAAHNPR